MLLLQLDRQIRSKAKLILAILPCQEVVATVDVIVVDVVVTARTTESTGDYTSWRATVVGR
jgi:hypothetical protein